MAPDIPNGIIFFGYGASPYARKVKQYLAFRNIAYAECIQPPILPRPDLNALGIQYRRIPLLAIGRDVYVDSRCIIRRLEQLFPSSSEHPALSSLETKGFAKLITRTVSDPKGTFERAVSFLNWNSGLAKDPKFRRDRAEFFGKGGGDAVDAGLARREAVVHMREVFQAVEEMLEGRKWLGGGEEVGIMDLEAVWPLDWLLSDLKPSQEYFSEKIYPQTFAWIARYGAALKTALERYGKPARVSGQDAVEAITGASFTDNETTVDERDPIGLKEGTLVKVFPTDNGGFTHQDTGRLVKLNREEVAISVKASNGKEVRVHAPRWNFRISEVKDAAKL